MAEKKTTRKPRKRVVSRKPLKTKTPEVETMMDMGVAESMPATSHETSPRKSRMMTIVALIILVLVGVGYLVKTYMLVAIVNKQPVFRWTVVKQLEQRYGSEAIDNIILNMLVKQEASKKGVTASSEEIDAEYQKIENNVKEQGQELNALLSMQGMTPDDLREQLEYKIILEKLVGSEISVTDEEIDAFIEERKDVIEKDANMDTVREEIREILKEQKLNEKASELTERLKTEASIQRMGVYQSSN